MANYPASFVTFPGGTEITLPNWAALLNSFVLPASVTKTAAYTVESSDHALLGDATSAAFSFTLPPAADCFGKIFYFRKIDSSSNAVTIDGNASETIDGATTRALSAQWTSIIIQSNGTSWDVLAYSPFSSSGLLPVASGGTGLSSFTSGDMLYASAATTLAKLGIGSAGKFMRSSGSAPAWSSATLPDTAASGDLLYGSATNAWSALAGASFAGNILRWSGTAPAWSTATYPNTWVSGDLAYASGTNSLGALAIGGADRVLTSSGSAPQWSISLNLGGSLAVTGNSTFTGELQGSGTFLTMRGNVLDGLVAIRAGQLLDPGGAVLLAGPDHASAGNVSIWTPNAGGTLTQRFAISGNVATATAALTGNLTVTGTGAFGAGSESLPSLSVGETDCGLYNIGTNNVGLSVNGAKVLDISTGGLAVTGVLSGSTSVRSLGTGGFTIGSVADQARITFGVSASDTFGFLTAANVRANTIAENGEFTGNMKVSGSGGFTVGNVADVARVTFGITAADTFGFLSAANVRTHIACANADLSGTLGVTGLSTLTGLKLAVASKSGAYTATTTDFLIHCSASGGAFSITLPAASGNTGLTYVIKKTDATANVVTVDANSTETIDGATTYLLSVQYQAVMIVCDGTGWHVV